MTKKIPFKNPAKQVDADAFVAKGKELYNEQEEPLKRLTLDLPESLHKTLKMKAVEEGSSMRDLITLWVSEKVSLK
jgi:predicted HicB family RNase H-like nuclease